LRLLLPCHSSFIKALFYHVPEYLNLARKPFNLKPKSTDFICFLGKHLDVILPEPPKVLQELLLCCQVCGDTGEM
jgi:hypothetical protein